MSFDAQSHDRDEIWIHTPHEDSLVTLFGPCLAIECRDGNERFTIKTTNVKFPLAVSRKRSATSAIDVARCSSTDLPKASGSAQAPRA